MPKSILDRTFRYVPAAKTNIRLTIAREKKRLAKLEELKARFNNVQPIKKEANK